jgi:2-iminoacetate synthase ThiH
MSVFTLANFARIHASSRSAQVHIVGGVLPQYDLQFYMELFSKIKNIAHNYI